MRELREGIDMPLTPQQKKALAIGGAVAVIGGIAYYYYARKPTEEEAYITGAEPSVIVEQPTIPTTTPPDIQIPDFPIPQVPGQVYNPPGTASTDTDIVKVTPPPQVPTITEAPPSKADEPYSQYELSPLGQMFGAAGLVAAGLLGAKYLAGKAGITGVGESIKGFFSWLLGKVPAGLEVSAAPYALAAAPVVGGIAWASMHTPEERHNVLAQNVWGAPFQWNLASIMTIPWRIITALGNPYKPPVINPPTVQQQITNVPRTVTQYLPAQPQPPWAPPIGRGETEVYEVYE